MVFVMERLILLTLKMVEKAEKISDVRSHLNSDGTLQNLY